MVTDRVNLVLEGLSKRQKGFTQREVASLFEHDINATSSTGNFESYNGILEHYGTVESIKTLEGVIISNNECFNRGFAHCTKPNYSVSMDLTTIISMVLVGNRQTLREIRIIDVENDSVLFTWRKRYFLNATDEQRFLVELIKPCKSVNEALDSMKPQAVKIALRHNNDVKRQGEYFLIPLPNLRDRDVKDLERIIEHKALVYDYNEEKDFVAFEKIFPEIEESRHVATRLGKSLGKTVVKGTVRHPEHRMLKLENWHSVVKNVVKESWSIAHGRD